MNHYPPRAVMPPQTGPAQRLNELLDNIKTEFEAESQRSVDAEGQSESCTYCLAAKGSSRRAVSKDRASKLSAHGLDCLLSHRAHSC